MSEIKNEDLQELLVHFAKNTYRAKDADSTSQAIMQRCLLISDIDYSHSVISNNGGELSAHYPSQMILFENEKTRSSNSDSPTPPPRTTDTIYESMYDINKLRELMKNARFARCRSRFPLPVILYKGKYICRSATLSGGPEIYGRSGLDYFFSGNDGANSLPPEEEVDEATGGELTSGDWQLFDRVRSHDIRLLKTLNVGTIVDFMVEKKKVKFGMNVTSSEKVDKEKRYSDFTIISLPYPGCEFFKEYRDRNYNGKGLVFDWSQAHVDATIGVPEDPVSTPLRVNWDQYKIWDLVQLTQNYMKLVLRYLTDNGSGLLIHCISGWDRTPLFVSLLRLSLWADGMIHQSLDAHQILYFTIAYDWMLFGHNLEDRLSKGEEIFFFCFSFLKNIMDEEYSILGSRCSKTKHPVLRNDSDCQLDNVMSDNESFVTISSVSSNLSLNSWCSSASQNSRDSQDNNPPAISTVSPVNEGQEESQNNGNTVPRTLHTTHNRESSGLGPRSPLPQTRTSPVAVPVSGRLRQRNESTSSVSGGSWQIISGTGSLRGSTMANSSGSETTSGACSTVCRPMCEVCPGQLSHDSSCTITEDGLSQTTLDHLTQRRKERLHNVRTLFYNVYCSAIGFKFKDGADSALGNLLGNFAEKVGILSTQRTSL
ncbi:myotubularin-related protein 14 isoform X1 [Neodiprion fabricii]|uniref:myotubularin-related protein 14 isoform X1 n=1 Tax=Neodiprion fabricii TaxID=2872261 RepID=UPI001ED96281|nr:myotubularin-related protein 14 isoform X1 [Neodiprion fabricii]